jgi:hypothetical protein
MAIGLARKGMRVLLLSVMVTMPVVTAAQAQGWEGHGRGEHEGWREHEGRDHEWREHEEWREREWREHYYAAPPVYYAAPRYQGNYYAPPPVVPMPPGFNMVIPLNIR